MTARRHTSHTRRWTRSISGLVCACLLVSGAAAVEEQGTTTTTIGLMSISSQTQDILPASVAEIRQAAEASLAFTFAARGQDLVSPAETLALQRRWRVRDNLVIAQGFLDDAAAELNAGRIAVVQIMLAPNRIFLAGRMIDTATGMLLGAGTVDPEPWTPETWADDLDMGLARLTTALDATVAPSRGVTLLILPAQTRGIARHDAETATHTLLETVLRADAVSIPDPAVLNARLIAAGHDPRRLGADALAELAATPGAQFMLVTEILSYDSKARGGSAIFDDGYEEAVPMSLPSLTYFARLVDLSTGTLSASAIRFYDDQPASGWFGFMHTPTSREVLGTTARELWADIGFHTEAFHDQATGSTRTLGAADHPGRSVGDYGSFGRRHFVRNDGPGHGQR